MRSRSRPRGLPGTIFRATLAVLLALTFGVGILIAIYRFYPPVSTLMLARWLLDDPVERQYVPLDRISPSLRTAVLVSEDARFCQHDGVDWDALREVMDRAKARRPIARRLDDPHADRKKPVFVAVAILHPKNHRNSFGVAARSCLVETPHFGGVFEHRRMGRRHFRRRSCSPPLFPQKRRQAGRQGGGIARNRFAESRAPQSGQTLPAPCGARRARHGASTGRGRACRMRQMTGKGAIASLAAACWRFGMAKGLFPL